VIKTDSTQRSRNNCRNHSLKISSQHSNILNTVCTIPSSWSASFNWVVIASIYYSKWFILLILLLHNIQTVIAKIKLPEIPHSMVIIRMKVRRSYWEVSSQADPMRENWTWSYTYTLFQLIKYRQPCFLFVEITVTQAWSRMIGDFITGSPGEMNYSVRF